MKSVAIVGAGIRGLSSAVYLKRRGCRVKIFEKSGGYGGIWTRVFSTSVINTPAHGYTFHADNRWPSHRADAGQILKNIDRMVEHENLSGDFRLNTPVDQVTRTESGAWRINDETEEFDGLLVASGYMGRQVEAPAEIQAAFRGRLLRPYDFVPSSLEGERVVVVGSGKTALEMLEVAVDQGCGRAQLLIRPEVRLREIKPYADLAFCIHGCPFFYPRGLRNLFRSKNKSPQKFRWVSSRGIETLLASPNVEVCRAQVREAHDNHLVLDDGQQLQADVIIWCTGWDPLIPPWTKDFKGDPTMVIASCKGCLDTGGFGNGYSTAHAKALYATLAYNLENRFTSDTDGCSCDQEPPQHTRHILLSLLIYFFKQPRGWRIALENLSYGAKSNWQRLRRSQEPWWAKAAAFVNAPFGL
jgi:cation diffusion facilitator CzcD-associated flavoprotein CzcO